MRVVGLPSSFYQLAKTKLGDLPADAQERLRWVSCWQALRQQGLTSSAAAEALGLPRSTLYRWDRSLRETGPERLCTKSGRPAWNRSTLAGEVFAVGTLGRRAAVAGTLPLGVHSSLHPMRNSSAARVAKGTAILSQPRIATASTAAVVIPTSKERAMP